MKDSASVEIKTKNVNFSEKLKLNELTTITVNRKDSILTAILDLRNSQILFVEEKKNIVISIKMASRDSCTLIGRKIVSESIKYIIATNL